MNETANNKLASQPSWNRFRANGWANCRGVERPEIPAEMLTICSIKIPIFAGSERRLSLLTPRAVPCHQTDDSPVSRTLISPTSSSNTQNGKKPSPSHRMTISRNPTFFAHEKVLIFFGMNRV
jgi:hypothetical protein